MVDSHLDEDYFGWAGDNAAVCCIVTPRVLSGGRHQFLPVLSGIGKGRFIGASYGRSDEMLMDDRWFYADGVSVGVGWLLARTYSMMGTPRRSLWL